MLKFRTMAEDAERGTGPMWAQPGDARSTAVGRVLRRFHLDELPQVVHVLRGEMSLVGPRPERPEFATRIERGCPGFARRLATPASGRRRGAASSGSGSRAGARTGEGRSHRRGGAGPAPGAVCAARMAVPARAAGEAVAPPGLTSCRTRQVNVET